MSAHTPGPWRFEKETVIDGESLAYPLHTIWTDRSLLLARTCFAPASEGNAQLIAAAPDLLAALQSLLADIEDYQQINHLGGHENHSQVMARAAIAKAEGSAS